MDKNIKIDMYKLEKFGKNYYNEFSRSEKNGNK